MSALAIRWLPNIKGCGWHWLGLLMLTLSLMGCNTLERIRGKSTPPAEASLQEAEPPLPASNKAISRRPKPEVPAERPRSAPASERLRPEPASEKPALEGMEGNEREVGDSYQKLNLQLQQLKASQAKLQAQIQKLETRMQTNFELLERSVSDSLAEMEQKQAKLERQAASRPAPAVTDNEAKPPVPLPPATESKSNLRTFHGTPATPKTPSKPPTEKPAPIVENYSLLNKAKTKETPESTELPSEESSEPALPSKIEPTNTNLPEPPLPLEEATLAPTPPKAQAEAKSASPKTSGFQDPDLQTPANPLALKNHPGAKKLYNEGMIALNQRKYIDAIEAFDNFRKQFPDDTDSDNASFWRGYSHFQIDQLEKAESAFREVLRQYEHRSTSEGAKTPDAIYMLGRISELKDDTDKAKYYFKAVMDRYPESSAAKNAENDYKALGTTP